MAINKYKAYDMHDKPITILWYGDDPSPEQASINGAPRIIVGKKGPYWTIRWFGFPYMLSAMMRMKHDSGRLYTSERNATIAAQLRMRQLATGDYWPTVEPLETIEATLVEQGILADESYPAHVFVIPYHGRKYRVVWDDQRLNLLVFLAAIPPEIRAEIQDYWQFETALAEWKDRTLEWYPPEKMGTGMDMSNVIRLYQYVAQIVVVNAAPSGKMQVWASPENGYATYRVNFYSGGKPLSKVYHLPYCVTEVDLCFGVLSGVQDVWYLTTLDGLVAWRPDTKPLQSRVVTYRPRK
jgi:hypothetical protein